MKKKIDDLFDENAQEEIVELEEVNVVSEGTEKDIIEDYYFAREKIITSIVRTAEVLDSAVKETKMAPSPRAIEAAAAIAKNLNDATANLLKLHESFRIIERTNSIEEKEKGLNTEDSVNLTLSDLLKKIEKNPGLRAVS